MSTTRILTQVRYAGCRDESEIYIYYRDQLSNNTHDLA